MFQLYTYVYTVRCDDVTQFYFQYRLSVTSWVKTKRIIQNRLVRTAKAMELASWWLSDYPHPSCMREKDYQFKVALVQMGMLFRKSREEVAKLQMANNLLSLRRREEIGHYLFNLLCLKTKHLLLLDTSVVKNSGMSRTPQTAILKVLSVTCTEILIMTWITFIIGVCRISWRHWETGIASISHWKSKTV